MFKKNDLVKIKPWDEILTTLELSGNNYRHRKTGLLIIPSEWLEDYGKIFEVIEKDPEDDTYCLQDACNYYHEDWLIIYKGV